MSAIGMMLFNNPNYWSPNMLPITAVPRKRFKERMIQDTAEISPQAALFSKVGLDFANSNVEFLASRTDINLEFRSSAFERLSANGYYAEERKELNLSLNFIFQKKVDVDGQTQTRFFEANLSFSASKVNTLSGSPFEKKEDIVELVRRLVNHISDIAKDGTKKLGGVRLDPEDFAEIAAIDNGKLAEILQSLIQWVMLYTNIMKEMKEGQESETVFLHPERRKYYGIEIQENSNTIKKFHLEIKDITKDYQVSDEQEEIEEGVDKQERIETTADNNS